MANYFAACDKIKNSFSSTADYVTYTVGTGGSDIFSGVQYKKPDDNYYIVNITDIARNYVSSPDMNGIEELIKLNEEGEEEPWFAFSINNLKKFDVSVYADSSLIGTAHDNIIYWYDYTKEPSLNRQKNDNINYAIDGYISPNQIIFANLYNYDDASIDASLTVNCHYFDEGEETWDPYSFTLFTSNLSLTGGNGLMIDVPYINENAGNTLKFFDGDSLVLKQKSNVSGATNWSTTYNVKSNCDDKYACYFTNKRGGWGSVLLNNHYVPSEKYTRYSITKEDSDPYVHTYNQNEVVHNKITKSIKLNTHLLNTTQSEMLVDDLFSSPCIILHELGTLNMWAVNISATSVSTKTTRIDKAFNYTIEFEYSQNIIRR